MKHSLFSILIFVHFFIFILTFTSYSQTPMYTILISTSMGEMKAVLYAETPLHSENFIDLVKKGFYNGQSFHRVINNFMIQAGNPKTKTTGDISDIDYTIPAEFNPSLYHKKAVIAAARTDDSVNPQRASSGSQFYIVQGRIFSDQELDLMVSKKAHIKFTEEQRKIYKTIGGAPHLDYAYTVFGEVINGLDVIDKIASVPVDKSNRPLKDIRLSIKIIE